MKMCSINSLLLPLSSIFPSVAIGVMAPLRGHGWPKGNPLKTLFPPVAIGVMAPLIGHGWPKGNPLKTLFAPLAL